MGTGRGKHRVKQFSMAGWLRAIGVSHWETGYAGENLSSQRCGFCMPLLWSEKCIATIYIYLIIFYKYVVIQSIFTVLYIYIYIGVAFCAVFEFQKSSHLQPLEWPQVAALLSGRKWPPSTRGRGIWISEKAATWSHSQPLEWPQVAASGRLYHITSWIRNWGKHPLAAAGSLPIHLNLKKTPFQQNIFFQDVPRLSPKSIT